MTVTCHANSDMGYKNYLLLKLANHVVAKLNPRLAEMVSHITLINNTFLTDLAADWMKLVCRG